MTLHHVIRRLAVLTAALLLPLGVAAQDKNAFTNAADAGPDFVVQGEYEGEIAGKGKLGAQVVGKGDGKFEVYFLGGGLPGAGWDQKVRVKTQAKTEGTKTVVAANKENYTGEIADGKLTGKLGDDAFTLKKVERKSPTLGAKPPEGAQVLFDGKSADQWSGGKIVENDLLFCGVTSKKGIGLGKLHVEFRTPFQPKAGGQGRGNSGVYVQGTETQVLDSFGLNGDSGECGGIYGKRKPDVNMCFPPLSWQTYDIETKEDKESNITLTVIHNGVKIHEDVVIKKGPAKPATINLQNHGNPVVYKNIWFVESK